ncbi:hypothetical protein Cgig2_031995 [Carnegiea gigantea]|uniref:Uncharacterized protein n=1 Tax=Carnegiea gigantea TaxID=171969 RepID=A0A9Q1GQ47_9CARY|nr:hypothetical protein Cgig2_031995 [Carnegiea gigantea]
MPALHGRRTKRPWSFSNGYHKQHSWKWENFQTIAEIWESIIYLGKPIASTDTFASMRILIDTKNLHYVEGRTKESLSMRFKPQYPSSSTLMEAMDSNDGVLGFEDIKYVQASSDGMDQSDLKEGGTHIPSLNSKEATELLGFQNNSNEEPTGDSSNHSIYSVSRIKTGDDYINSTFNPFENCNRTLKAKERYRYTSRF